MKNLNVSFPITSVILSWNLLILSPVLAQVNFNSNPVGSESLSNSNVIYTPLVDQLSSQNEFPLVSSNSEPKVSQTPVQQIERLYSSSPPNLGENITNVHQLEDVTSDDWAYEALRNLVEKYRCISAFPGRNFRGNRAMTRYEFAVGLNTCLQSIRRSIESLNNKFPQQEDLVVIERLQAEFATELQNITAKIDKVSQRVNFLQEHQFSPTTVLRGIGLWDVTTAFGDKKAVSPESHSDEELKENLTLSAATILIFDTSFTGKDRLRTQVVAGNINSLGSNVTGTEMTLLVGGINTNNNVRLGSLFYQFPIGKRGIISIAPVADFPTRIFPVFNPVSAISNFGAVSPIYSFAFGSGGIIYYNLTDNLAAGITYLTTSASKVKEGLFNGQYTVLTQVSYTPSEQIGVAFTYGHYYAPEPGATINITGSKGSTFAQLPFGESTATSSDAFGLQFTYKLSSKLILGGWLSYFNAKAEGSPSVSGLNGYAGSQADIWSWAFTAFLSDLGKAGSQLNFVFGMPPKVINNDIFEREDRDTSLHFELSYSYPVNDRISITPGFFVITNPEHNAENSPIWMGLLRTTFIF
ncbi:iron uptake porin [Planktothrix sp. FACHB-1355]|uniref:Iron uptake porin n=2 Tax=Cyanophyceae TaxID=3028117 RepID=A0A926ZHX6_9CYAN|nr:iron uptake porin [Planktothrix sp. FACHB-1355]MBD2183530.1 iron uptake porin [Aerosakkonema funiforme FACHB-1375]MBD3560850.1 iron uptake porin [Planktothrix sp. FACHB-1355]